MANAHAPKRLLGHPLHQLTPRLFVGAVHDVTRTSVELLEYPDRVGETRWEAWLVCEGKTWVHVCGETPAQCEERLDAAMRRSLLGAARRVA